MNASDPLHQLARQVRWLKFYCLFTTVLLAAALFTAAAKSSSSDELSVGRLNIVDEDGKVRLVLANADRFPAPIVGGKVVERAVKPAGLVFFNAKGDEVGGLALTDVGSGRLSALAFDYANADAVGVITSINPTGKDAVAGLVINSRPDESLDIAQASKASNRRIELVNRNELAELVMNDSQGRPRVRLAVDREDHPSLEMLEESGKAVYSVRR